MAFSDDLFFAPAHKLAAMLRARDVSSVEMVDAFIERIESVNHGLNAVVTLVEDRAAREAEDSRPAAGGKGEVRPLEGLPITIKDSIITEGVRSTWGMKMFRASCRQAGCAHGRAAARGRRDRYREDQHARDDDGLRLRQSRLRADQQSVES